MTNEEIAMELTNHKDRLQVVEKGVGNFRDFQLDMTRKVGFVYGVTRVAGIVGTVLLAVFVWALSLIIPAVKAITTEYYHNHPSAVYQNNSQAKSASALYVNTHKQNEQR